MHDCDCRQLEAASPLPDALLVRGSSPHALHHIALAWPNLAARGDAWELLPTDFGALKALWSQLSPTLRAEVQVAPMVAGEVQFWETASLEAWRTRLDSPWFAQAAKRLFFELQPVVDLARWEVFGREALVRAEWAGRVFGAGELLRAARAHGQLRAFDARARIGAIEQAYQDLGPSESLLINFAPGVVYHPRTCLATTFAACRTAGADFSRLVFEVTESEAFPDLTLLRAILDEYRAHGARVALDDLGAGHTSLLYLRELQPDLVKLDRGLIAGLHARDPRFALVGALIEYAHSLGVRVVAEGVESLSELALVMQLGADFGQGYALARPSRRPDAIDWRAVRNAALAAPIKERS